MRPAALILALAFAATSLPAHAASLTSPKALERHVGAIVDACLASLPAEALDVETLQAAGFKRSNFSRKQYTIKGQRVSGTPYTEQVFVRYQDRQKRCRTDYTGVRVSVAPFVPLVQDALASRGYQFVSQNAQGPAIYRKDKTAVALSLSSRRNQFTYEVRIDLQRLQ